MWCVTPLLDRRTAAWNLFVNLTKSSNVSCMVIKVGEGFLVVAEIFQFPLSFVSETAVERTLVTNSNNIWWRVCCR